MYVDGHLVLTTTSSILVYNKLHFNTLCFVLLGIEWVHFDGNLYYPSVGKKTIQIIGPT